MRGVRAHANGVRPGTPRDERKAAYEEALAKGLGAINVDGVMVDAASIRILQNIIDQADQAFER